MSGLNLDRIKFGRSDKAWLEGVQTTATSGSDVTIFTSTAVPVGKSRYLDKVDISCYRAGKYTILVGASIIGSGRIRSSDKDESFIWPKSYKLVAGEQLEVKFDQRGGTSAEIEVYAHGIEE